MIRNCYVICVEIKSGTRTFAQKSKSRNILFDIDTEKVPIFPV